MDSIIVIIGVIVAIMKVVNNSNKVKKNAPGQTAAPQRPAVRPPAASVSGMRTEPVKTAPQPVRTPAAPTVKSTVAAPANPQPSVFWQQISEALKEELGPEKKDRGHAAVGKMAEGDSRECEHGSVGGSMAYDGHADGGEGRAKARRASDFGKEEGRIQATDALYRPAMNAQEMRRAVVMAEILKRPQERMAEQARRWSVR